MAYHVLIVDDSLAMRAVIRKVMKMTGLELECHEADSGMTALQVLDTTWIDLVMTDINMPGMDGLELIRKIRQNAEHPDLPVLVISTEGRDDILSSAQELGVSGYLKKPFQPVDLRNIILNVLEKQNADVGRNTDHDDEDGDF